MIERYWKTVSKIQNLICDGVRGFDFRQNLSEKTRSLLHSWPCPGWGNLRGRSRTLSLGPTLKYPQQGPCPRPGCTNVFVTEMLTVAPRTTLDGSFWTPWFFGRKRVAIPSWSFTAENPTHPSTQKKVKVKKLSKNDTPKKIGEGNCFCYHLIGKTIEVNWWHPKGNTNFLRFYTPFCYFCCTNFPPIPVFWPRERLPKPPKMTMHLQEDQQEEAKSTDWLEGPGIKTPGPLQLDLASVNKSVEELKKGEMWHILFTSSLHWTMIGIRMTNVLS